MYSIVEAARILSVPAAQLARWVALGRIPDAKLIEGDLGPVWRLPRDTIDQVAQHLDSTRKPSVEATAAAERPSMPVGVIDVDAASSKPAPALRAPNPLRHRRAPRPSEPTVTYKKMKANIDKERVHWQRLAELQADTIAGLRRELEEAHNDIEHLRERLVEMEDGRDAQLIIGRSTLDLAARPFATRPTLAEKLEDPLAVEPKPPVPELALEPLSFPTFEM